MKLVLAAVGKLRHAAYRSLCDEYQARIAHYVRFEELELKDAAALGRFVKPEAWVVALEVHGRALSSTELARELGEWLSLPRREVVFLVGGADGIPKEVSHGADVALSLSRMTLPHRLARALLCEQLYRAFSIQKGEPYAREE